MSTSEADAFFDAPDEEYVVISYRQVVTIPVIREYTQVSYECVDEEHSIFS
jgi:hypothetical protein